MSQGSSHTVETSTHGPVMADELALELAGGRIEYFARLIISALAKEPYLRSRVSDGWSWPEMRPFIQELVDETLTAGGAASRRWAEVSAEATRALSSLADPSTNMNTAARELSDVGTHLMNVLMLIDLELTSGRVEGDLEAD